MRIAMGRWALIIALLITLMMPGSLYASETQSGIENGVNQFQSIKLGDSGNRVKEIQVLLSKNVYTISSIDGIFGPLTEQAVKDFQSSAGLESNGIIDQATYNKLKEERSPVTYTLTANLWVRNKPSINGAVVGTRDVLEKVEVYGFENGWARIKFDTSPAYVAGNYLRQGAITEGTPKTYTLIRDLWVRDRPNGKIIGTRDAYEQVEVYGFENGWARIKFDYYPAYVFGNYIQEGVIPRPTTNTTASRSNTGLTVYWVDGGEVYHLSSDCPTLSRSSNIHSGTIAESGKPRVCDKCSYSN